MTTQNAQYAQIPTGKNRVFNTVVMSEDFKIAGYFFVQVPDGVICEPDDYYNKDDNLFYKDELLTTLSGTSGPVLMAGTAADLTTSVSDAS